MKNVEKRFLTYEEFGAHGDGVTDDIAAIVACHKMANEKGLPVRAKSGAEYYIGAPLTAVIKTDTDFGTAKFIIDDTVLSIDERKASIFSVESDLQTFTPDIKSIKKGENRLIFPHTGNVYVRVFSSDGKIYIRKGLNQNSGTDPSDAFICDGDGFIKNELNWSYENVSRVYAKSIDDTPITIAGGIFITRANRAPSKYTYYSRNFSVSRSNVTIRALTHYIIGEGEHGAPYSGFIDVNECANFLAEDLLLTPHLTYRTASQIPGKDVSMGSYDLTIDGAIGVRLVGIRQTVDITDGRYWGLMGSNFSKDVQLEGCVMSRFDAHCGVTGASIKNTTLGHAGLNLIGFGRFYIENSTVLAGAFINFRADYGSFFNGKIEIKNCKWIMKGSRSIFSAHNTGEHDFGYKCMLPCEIKIDGLAVIDTSADCTEPLYILPDYDPDYEQGKPFSYGVPETVYISNISVPKERELALCRVTEEYLDTQVECL